MRSGYLSNLISQLIEERNHLKQIGISDSHVKKIITTIYGIMGQSHNVLYNSAIVQVICGISRIIMDTL